MESVRMSATNQYHFIGKIILPFRSFQCSWRGVKTPTEHQHTKYGNSKGWRTKRVRCHIPGTVRKVDISINRKQVDTTCNVSGQAPKRKTGKRAAASLLRVNSSLAAEHARKRILRLAKCRFKASRVMYDVKHQTHNLMRKLKNPWPE